MGGSRGSQTSEAQRTAAGSTSPPSWTSTLLTRTMKTIRSVPRRKRVRVEAVMRSGRRTILSVFRKKPNKTCDDERLGDTDRLLELVLSLDLMCVLFCNCTCHSVYFAQRSNSMRQRGTSYTIEMRSTGNYQEYLIMRSDRCSL